MRFQADVPNWAPLEAVVPLADCADWMWMCTVYDGDRPIEQYKHRDTRNYLSLGHDGQAWQWTRPDVDWCPPFCDLAHECVPEPDAVASPVPLDDALALALS